jgi:hypothetical protein
MRVYTRPNTVPRYQFDGPSHLGADDGKTPERYTRLELADRTRRFEIAECNEFSGEACSIRC